MGIPECILTVTTRITKYPLLIEPLIKTAKDRPAEQQKLRSCLSLVKSILIDVNGQVSFCLLKFYQIIVLYTGVELYQNLKKLL